MIHEIFKMVQKWSSELVTCPGEHEWLKSKKKNEKKSYKRREQLPGFTNGLWKVQTEKKHNPVQFASNRLWNVGTNL